MKRQAVSSSVVASVGYDGESSVLEVEFLHGDVYRYFDVPVEVFQAFVGATSIGTFLNREIKDRFRYENV